MLGMARAGRPFLMNIQSNEVTRQRMDLYRRTMRESGFDEASIARNVDNTWVWRNIFVAESDAEAERLPFPHGNPAGIPPATRRSTRAGVLLKAETEPAHAIKCTSILCGSPATVCEAIAEIDRMGVGGLILVFRIGPMSAEVAESSIRLFMQKVAPEFR
jgi:alkanesulfonate monooxygenase SsuD/methylene tetrahydromethanopterin reductase-like flavin-dependent oxidoreductase (luciferase family)